MAIFEEPQSREHPAEKYISTALEGILGFAQQKQQQKQARGIAPMLVKMGLVETEEEGMALAQQSPEIQKVLVAGAMKQIGKAPVLSPFEKKMQEGMAENAMTMYKSLPKIQAQKGTLNRILSLNEKMGGIPGYAKSFVGSRDATELNALGLAALEPVLKVFNPAGVLPQSKIEMIKDKFAPKASDRRSVVKAKVDAIKRFTDMAEEQARNAFSLMKTGKITPEEFDEGLKSNLSLIDQVLEEPASWEGEEQKKKDEEVEEPLKEKEAEMAIPPGTGIAEEAIGEELMAPAKEEVEKEAKGFWDKFSDFTKGAAELEAVSEEFERAAESGVERETGIGLRAAPKAVGAMVDFGNLISDLVIGKKIPIEKMTEESFGKAMSFQDLGEEFFDYITGKEYVPDHAIERIFEKSIQAGGEMALIPGGAKADLFGKGWLSGLLSQSAKESGLDEGSQVMASLLPFLGDFKDLAKGGIDLMKGAYELAKNPKKLEGMLKDFSSYIRGKSLKPLAVATKAQRKIKPEQVIPSRAKELMEAKDVSKVAKKPLSELFDNEQVLSMETRMAQLPATKEIYKPLFEEMTQKYVKDYAKILGEVSRTDPEKAFKLITDATSKKEIKDLFKESLYKERALADESIGKGFDLLRKYRPKGERVSWKDTKELIKSVDESIDHLHKGGLISKDSEPLKYLESFKARLLKAPPETAGEIKKLKEEIAAIEKTIGTTSVVSKKELAPRLKKIEKLSKSGALVEEVEQGFRKINAALNYGKPFQYKDIPRLDLKTKIKKALENYGKTKNPKYYKQFVKMNEVYSNYKDTLKSDIVFNTLSGKRPDAIYGLLDNPSTIKDFKAIIASGDLELNYLGNMVITSKINDILYPKLFSEGAQMKESTKRFTQLTSMEKDKLAALMGRDAYDGLKKLQGEIATNQKKLNAYLNTSKTAVTLTSDAKEFMRISGLLDMLSGNFKKGTKKLFYSNYESILGDLYTDQHFQKMLLDIVQESKKTKPTVSPLNKVASYVKKKLKKYDATFKSIVPVSKVSEDED